MILNTMADLKSVLIPTSQRIFIDLLGFNTPGDGGGGRFWYDGAASEADDGGTIIAPNTGGGRWKRVFTGPVNVDWFGANKASDSQSAFVAASAFPHVACSNRTYRMEGTISIKAGQTWDFNGATIYHTDSSKIMFSAVNVDCWTLRGPATLKGTLTGSGWADEKGLYISGCNRYRVHALSANLFRRTGIHIADGTFSGALGDQGIFSDCAAHQCMESLRVDAGSAAEYCLFTNFNATGSITAVIIGGGNTTMNGLSITNCDIGVSLIGGPNNAHGIIAGSNINHCGQTAIIADGVTNGFTFDGCHIYSDSPTTGHIRMQNGSTRVVFTDCIIDAPVVNDSGINRVTDCNTLSKYGVTGAVPAGLIASGNY
jgi:hypothetical protein